MNDSLSEYLPVAEQLRLLFETILHPDGRPYTLSEVSEQTGISLATISQLRNGKIKNPQLGTLRSLCQFFGVPLRYFETRAVEECYAILAEDRGQPTLEINEIAFRATSLSPKSQRDILTIIKWVQAAEQQRQASSDLPPLPGLEGDDDETTS
jgi:transcriptional regulator with XRE-family HTH domain